MKPQKLEMKTRGERTNRRSRTPNSETINVEKSGPITTSTTVKVGE